MGRVLLIDDDAAVAAANRAALLAAGHEVALASSVAEGLSAAAAQPPDVVVLEALLAPDLCDEIGRRLPRTPIIVLTRLDDQLDRGMRDLQDRDGGWIAADLYLQKPVAPALLVHEVEHALHEEAA
jgi:DNA-binding response OmpR family regulator